jgi:hypothetical protein
MNMNNWTFHHHKHLEAERLRQAQQQSLAREAQDAKREPQERPRRRKTR